MVARRNLTLDDVAKSWLVGSPVKFRLRPELSGKTSYRQPLFGQPVSS